MRLLVTGGAGYIGSIVAGHLLSRGHDVVILDNLEQGHREAVPSGAELVVADLLNRDALGQAVDQLFDAVLHFAALALVGESGTHPERYYRTNVGGRLEPVRGDESPGGATPGVLVDVRRVWTSQRGYRYSETASDQADECVWPLEAGGRLDDQRLLPRRMDSGR